MPIVRISQAIRTVAVGDAVQVSADDPSFTADLEAWVSMTGHELRSVAADGPIHTACIVRVR